ncbi:hypothetical protein sos41_13490 [Alphaproteobacteria bacterium SO-S41]|nr:hypothetical protein sos41_13490 [Alphaproteobacteria bacterium SO-S41]
MSDPLRILIVGGYGTFGGRIVELLENEPRIVLIIAGRSAEKARAYIATRRTGEAVLIPAAFDRDGDLGPQLAALTPQLVIDASGPFQAYGATGFALIEACIRARLSYLDLADGADFVAGVAAYDEAAKAAGIFVLSGVSSFPVLTAAVVRRLGEGLAGIETIEGGIAPSPYAGVGLNVIRAISSYAGRPTPIRRDGQDITAYPFTDHARVTIAPPGALPLTSTLFSLVDVPDLRALQQLWPNARTVWMGAGPVPAILHRALIACAWLVRLRLLPPLTFMAGLMHWSTNRLRWGEHRGGMFVRIAGRDSRGAPARRSWHMLAEGDDGPLIPSMAVEALVRKHLDGHVPAPGARAATAELELADYEALFDGRRITTGFCDDAASPQRLYPTLLGEAWKRLPYAIRAIHEGDLAEGVATVERGRNPLGHLGAWIAGFPPAAKDIPVTVRFDETAGVETWTRRFGPYTFSSRQYAGAGRWDRLLVERFGAMTFAMALVVEEAGLRLVIRHWRLLGIPLPLWLAPRSNSFEAEKDGAFRFHVEISHPLTGLIVRYRGRLKRR